MTAQEIIEKIRADVERLQHTDTPHTDEWWDGADYVRRRMKEVLSDLEKEEKPTIQEQPVCEDDEKYFSILEGFLNTCWGEYFLLHEREDFQNWIENRLKPACKERTLCGDFDLESDRFFRKLPLRANTPPIPDEYIDEETFDRIARHFAQWGAEHLKKNK